MLPILPGAVFLFLNRSVIPKFLMTTQAHVCPSSPSPNLQSPTELGTRVECIGQGRETGLTGGRGASGHKSALYPILKTSGQPGLEQAENVPVLPLVASLRLLFGFSTTPGTVTEELSVE